MVFSLQVGAMKNPSKRILAFIFAGFSGVAVHAQDLDAIGVSLLRAVTTNLNGAGIRVAQPEAYNGDGHLTRTPWVIIFTAFPMAWRRMWRTWTITTRIIS